jgi:hypothetical protein
MVSPHCVESLAAGLSRLIWSTLGAGEAVFIREGFAASPNQVQIPAPPLTNLETDTPSQVSHL